MNRNDVFVSYKRTDKEFVRKVDAELRKHGYEVWVDWEDIPPGVDDFRDEIESGILHAQSCVLVLSPDYLESEYCVGELNSAVRNGKRIIPIVYREVDPRNVPLGIAHINWVFFNKEDDFENAFQKLLVALETDLQHVRAHTRLLTRAAEWEKNNYDNSFILIGKDLQEAEKWLVASETKEPLPTPLQKSYISASVRTRNVRNRITWLYRVILVAMIAAFIFGVIAAVQSVRARAEAERAEENAERARSMELAARANSVFDTDPSLAIALALEATHILNPPPKEVERSLARAVYSPGARQFFSGHDGAVTSVDYSPDGLWGVSGGTDGTIRIWDLQKGTPHLTLKGHGGSVNSVAFSADGKHILSGSDDATARLWDAATGALLNTYEHFSAILSVAISPDGKYGLTGAKGGQMLLWNLQTARVIQNFSGHEGDVFDVEFSLSGTYALSGSGQRVTAEITDELLLDRTLRVWDVQTGEEIRRIHHRGFVRSVCFISGGREVASASWDEEGGKIQIWNLATGDELKLLTGHTNVIDSIDCDRDGRFIVSGARDNSLRVWDSKTGLEVQRFDHLENTINAVVFSPDGRSVLTGFGRSSYSLENNSLVLWDLTSGAELRQFIGHRSWVRSIAFSPDGRYVLSGSGGFNEVGDPVVRLWEIATGEVVHYLEGHEAQVLSVAFSPVEPLALTASQDGQIILWNLETGEALTTFNGHGKNAVNAVSFSPNGKFFASASSDKTTIVWNLSTGDAVFRLRGINGHGEQVNSVQFSADGRYILTASGSFDARSTDNTIRLWNAANGEFIKTFEGHSGRVSQAIFMPDTTAILSVGSDQKILLWDIETGQIVRQFGDRNDVVNSVAVSPDGQYALTGSNDATVVLWEIATGEQIRRFTGHTNWVESVAFSSDGTKGLSGSSDTTVRMWQLTSTYQDLLQWTCTNRHIREFTENERNIYNIAEQTSPCT